MSKNVKILLIIAAGLAFLAAVCVGGVFYLGSLVPDNGEIDGLYEGREFGKTTDNAGCQTKMIELTKPLKSTDMSGILKTQYFFDGCLETSRPTPGFCDGAVNPYSDIFNEHKGKDAACEKLGMKGSIPCRLIIDKKMDFCMGKK